MTIKKWQIWINFDLTHLFIGVLWDYVIELCRSEKSKLWIIEVNIIPIITIHLVQVLRPGLLEK